MLSDDGMGPSWNLVPGLWSGGISLSSPESTTGALTAQPAVRSLDREAGITYCLVGATPCPSLHNIKIAHAGCHKILSFTKLFSAPFIWVI